MRKYSRETHKAYPEISINRHPTLPRSDWVARVYSYQPLGWKWGSEIYPEWPSHVQKPVYPEYPHNGSRDQINAWRQECNRISSSNPMPHHLVEEMKGYSEAETSDIAYQNAHEAAQHAIEQVMQWQLR